MTPNQPTGETMSEGSPPAAAALGEKPAAEPVTVSSDLFPGCKPGDTYTVKSAENGTVVLERSSSEGGESDETYDADMVSAMKGADEGAM